MYMYLRALAVSVVLAVGVTRIAAQEALHFSGSLQHVTIPHNDALSIQNGGTMTIELWVKPPPIYGGWHVLGKRSDCIPGCQTCNYQLYAASSVEFASGACSTFATGLAGDTWTHLAVAADAAGTTVYENGVVAGQSTCTIGGANTAAFWIGGTTDCSAPFQGDLDEVRLWNIARTQAQIGADSVRIIDPATPGLVAYWRFEEAVDSQAVLDSTAHALDGTLGSDDQVGVDDPTHVS